MGRLALAIATCAIVAALIPGGMYLAMGMGSFAAAAGFVAYRRTGTPPWSRLAGALGMTVALLALVLAGGRYALTWWAVGRLTQLIS